MYILSTTDSEMDSDHWARSKQPEDPRQTNPVSLKASYVVYGALKMMKTLLYTLLTGTAGKQLSKTEVYIGDL